ncbi:MAG TPA: XdhC family protein [Candidatus Sulfotelmatobacter sp.]|jgi:xanthine dehydrogenase accessory factor|nr:XdhC family protein [Candidatus Sulfotelmatobacter sp.]
MFDRFLKKATELVAKGEPFVTASVVRFQAPISGKPGDKAIIFVNGGIWGWIGGGCAQPVVIKEALNALADGRPRMVRISPSAAPEDGIIDYTMTCHSGGTLDIYIEPILPKPHVLIIGRSPVAQTLARLAKAVDYRISVVAPGADQEQFPDVDLLQTDLNLDGLKITPDTFIVVSTQGEGDEEALEKAAGTNADYVAFVASSIKAKKVLEYLGEVGVSSERTSRIRAPAGLDIRATSPEEIAVSILAEIIQRRSARRKPLAEANKSALPVLNKQSRDPVCGMLVDVSSAKYTSEHNGSEVYFCCAGCKQAFDRQPEKYTLSVSS